MKKATIILITVFLISVSLFAQILAEMPDVEKALDEIDATPDSPYFTAEMKQQTRDMLTAAIRGMNASLYDEMDSNYPADMEQVRSRRAGLEVLLADK